MKIVLIALIAVLLILGTVYGLLTIFKSEKPKVKIVSTELDDLDLKVDETIKNYTETIDTIEKVSEKVNQIKSKIK